MATPKNHKSRRPKDPESLRRKKTRRRTAKKTQMSMGTMPNSGLPQTKGRRHSDHAGVLRVTPVSEDSAYCVCDNCEFFFSTVCVPFSRTDSFVRSICFRAAAQREQCRSKDDGLSDRPEHASGGGCREILLIVPSLVRVSEHTCSRGRPLPRRFGGSWPRRTHNSTEVFLLHNKAATHKHQRAFLLQTHGW